MKLLPDPIWPWPWVVLAAAGTLATVILTYRQRLAPLPSGTRRLLLGLRLFAWAILVFSLVRPVLEFTRHDPHGAVYLIAADASRSMSVKDATAGVSRREALIKVLEDAAKEVQLLGNQVEIRHFDFDQDARPVESYGSDALGEQTAIGYVLDALPKLAQGKRVGGVLLLSDGALRAVSPFDVDPRGAATRLADQQIRVDTVGFGGSGLTDASLDLIAEDLEVSPTVFVKNTVVVGAKVRALGAANRNVVVQLLLEQPTGRLPGQPAKMSIVGSPLTLKPRHSQELLPVEMSFVAENPGEFKLTLEVVPLEGEPQTVNNSLTTYLTVLKGGISVAYFDREHRPEQKYIRRIDESPDIRLDFKPIRPGPAGTKSQLETEWFEPGKYDVYIIGSVPARVFGRELSDKLSQAVEQGAGLMMTGGTLSFGPGGYAETSLADALPVEMLRTELQNGDTPDPTLHYDEPLQMLPTNLGLQHFIMRIDSPEKNLARWRSLPPLDGANKFHGVKRGAVTLAVAGDKPLLIAQSYGRGRTLAFAADSTYHWYQDRAVPQEHQRFWQQAMLWLAHKDESGDESVWLKLDSRRFRVGQPVGMTFGARDPEKRSIDDAEFRIEVLGPGDRRHIITPQKSGGDHLARFLETREPGEYRVRIEAFKGDHPIGLPAEARFIVFEQDLELHNPAADLTLLEEIARITGGSAVPPEELGAHLRRLVQQGLNLELTESKRISLWDNWVVLLLFVAALSFEWFVRKRRGLV